VPRDHGQHAIDQAARGLNVNACSDDRASLSSSWGHSPPDTNRRRSGTKGDIRAARVGWSLTPEQTDRLDLASQPEWPPYPYLTRG
jgi:hypothetical protein